MFGDNAIHKLSEELWKASGKMCQECRSKRSVFECLEKERNREWEGGKKKVNFYCPPYLGFYHPSSFLIETFREKGVFFVLESIGGGRPWKRKEDITFKEPMMDLEQYYCSSSYAIEKYHQYCMREILTKMDEKGIPFFATDVVKCFVVNNKGNNFKTAAETCSRNFLRRQIFELKPNLVVVFGGLARNALKGLATDVSKSKIAALNTKNHSKKINVELTDKEQHYGISLIYSIFPTANRNADDWVKLDAKDKLLEAIYGARESSSRLSKS